MLEEDKSKQGLNVSILQLKQKGDILPVLGWWGSKAHKL